MHACTPWSTQSFSTAITSAGVTPAWSAARMCRRVPDASMWIMDASRVQQATAYPTFFTAGIFQDPSMIEGSFSLGQYIRSIRMNLPSGAGNQLDSLSAPGEACWM